MQVIFALGFLALAVINYPGIPKNYSKIDAYAKATPEIKAVNVDELVSYLIIPAKDDSEKVRSIFTWMTSHISYDWDAYNNNRPVWQEPAVTLQRRKGVCQNYSDLFTALCLSAGLEAQTITGYAKSGIDNSWILSGFGAANHAWNVVKVSGRWQLMDVTWAENTVSTNYFMTAPLLFRRDHLPVEHIWQLTKDTLSLKDYEHMPILEDGFDRFHITHLTPAMNTISGKKKIVFAFDSAHNLNLVAKVSNFDYSRRAVPEFAQVATHTGNHYILTLTFTAEDTYWVMLENQDSFGAIVLYVVDTHVTGNTSR